jgi:hypothetical protein
LQSGSIEGIAIGRHPNPTLCGFEKSPPKVGGVGGLYLEYMTQDFAENIGICPEYCY